MQVVVELTPKPEQPEQGKCDGVGRSQGSVRAGGGLLRKRRRGAGRLGKGLPRVGDPVAGRRESADMTREASGACRERAGGSGGRA